MNAPAIELDNAVADYDSLPEAMRSAKRWLVWKSLPNRDPAKKPGKVPYYVTGVRRTGELDSATDIASLASFEDAHGALLVGDYSGLGFALGPDGTGNYWQGIDLDDIPNRAHLNHIAGELPGYTEKSPSGCGMHAIGYGRLFGTLGSNATGIEAYSRGRFFTVTGENANRCPPTCLANFVEQRLKPIHGGRQESATSTDSGQLPETVSPQVVADLRSALRHMPSDDRHLWVRMGMALKTLGAVGRGLWLDWSATSDKHDPKADPKKWNGFKATRTGYQAVFAEAQRQGWKNPESRNAMDRIDPSQEFEAITVVDDADTAERISASAEANVDAKGNKPNYHLLTFDEIAARPPVAWVVKHVLPAQGIAAIYGQPGSGKSLLVLDMLAAVADGREWFGHRCHSVPVVYVVLEGEAGMAQRAQAYRKRHGDDAGKRMRFVTAPFRLLGEGNALALCRAILESCGRRAIVVIDTLNQSTPGSDENSSQDMGEAIAMCKEMQLALGGLVLLVHHTGKDASRGLRGHSSLHAALDAAIEVSRREDERSWKVAKAKDGADGISHAFKLEYVALGVDADLDEIGSCVIVPGGSAPRGKPLTASLQAALDSLVEASIAHGQPFPDDFIGGTAAHRECWRDAFYRVSTAENQEAKRKAFKRARDDLVKLGRVHVLDDIYRPAEEQVVIELRSGTRDSTGT